MKDASFSRSIRADLLKLTHQKLVILSGPRQVGKTALSQTLHKNFRYYNYDIKEDYRVFHNNEWDRKAAFVIFDEIHKMRRWKLWLKDIVDSGRKNEILVTGSARMDVAKKVGDSLAGRYFSMRLNPLDLKELRGFGSTEENYRKLLSFGGFPEPFFKGTETFYNLWKRTHSDIILKQDLIVLENIRDIDGIELLVELLSERVGSTISMSQLAKDIGRDDKTIAKWLRILENLFVVFKVSPFSKNMALALKKMPKYYFYDLGKVQGDEAAKLENVVALSLKKEIEFLQDTGANESFLYYAKNKQHAEIDFIVQSKHRPAKLIEVKLSDDQVSKNFHYFSPYFPKCEKIQLVRNLDRPFQNKDGVSVQNALSYLEQLDLR
jgi:predicted AAA+ superfamily ATPase